MQCSFYPADIKTAVQCQRARKVDKLGGRLCRQGTIVLKLSLCGCLVSCCVSMHILTARLPADFTLPPIHDPRGEVTFGSGTPITATVEYPPTGVPHGYPR